MKKKIKVKKTVKVNVPGHAIQPEIYQQLSECVIESPLEEIAKRRGMTLEEYKKYLEEKGYYVEAPE